MLFRCGQWNSTACLWIIISNSTLQNCHGSVYLLTLLPPLESWVQKFLSTKCSSAKTSAAAEQHANVWENQCLHIVAWLSHKHDQFCLWQLTQRWRWRRARVCTKGYGLWAELAGGTLRDRWTAGTLAAWVSTAWSPWKGRLGAMNIPELLAHHWGAAFPYMMRSCSRFPIGTCHKPKFQKLTHKSRQCWTADVATKAEQQEFFVVLIWRKFWCGINCNNLPSLNVSSSRIYLVSTNWKFCCGNPQQESL